MLLEQTRIIQRFIIENAKIRLREFLKTLKDLLHRIIITKIDPWKIIILYQLYASPRKIYREASRQ